MTKKLVFCSTNKGKLSEVQKVCSSFNWSAMPPDRFLVVKEDAQSYLGNAQLKAHSYFTELQLPVLADDSGIEVDGLNGAPGIYSARFAGEGATDRENLDLLLKKIEGCKIRTARYVSSVVFLDVDGELSGFGTFEGVLINSPAGRGGFGYDPVFVPTVNNPDNLTLSQLKDNGTPVKTHRVLALEDLFRKLSARQTG